MKSITVIPARKTAKGAPLVSQQKLKVAAYCRVSTDSDEQATSYDAQIKYYTELIFHLRELQQQTDSDETTKAIQMERIKELQDFIGQQGSELTEFDEKLVKRWLRQITVWDDHYTVELKSGLSIDVPA